MSGVKQDNTCKYKVRDPQHEVESQRQKKRKVTKNNYQGNNESMYVLWKKKLERV